MFAALGHARAHSRLLLSAGVGLAAAWLTPAALSWLTRGLVGWNVGVWLYLIMAGWLMFRASQEHLQAVARAQAESATAVLLLATLAAIVSFGAVVAEVAAAKGAGTRHVAPHLLLALATVTGSWLLLPTLFALTYASRFHDEPGGKGLRFPGTGDDDLPDYLDFAYFSFTIAVASQTSDVTISSRAVRRLVLLQSVLSFAFNTSILAFTINIAASLF